MQDLAPTFWSHLVSHPHTCADVIFVLDFGFGKRGSVVKTPVNRLAAAEDVSLLHEIKKGAGDDCLVAEIHRQVGIVPTAKDAKSLEISFVLLNKACGKLS